MQSTANRTFTWRLAIAPLLSMFLIGEGCLRLLSNLTNDSCIQKLTLELFTLKINTFYTFYFRNSWFWLPCLYHRVGNDRKVKKYKAVWVHGITADLTRTFWFFIQTQPEIVAENSTKLTFCSVTYGVLTTFSWIFDKKAKLAFPKHVQFIWDVFLLSL